jgi:hypothetical protein
MVIITEDKDNITVEALSVDKIHIKYECPYCWRLRNGKVVPTPFMKNGKPYKSAKRNIHFHGSGDDFSHRTEHRSSHCLVNRDKGVYIVINENTKMIKK